MKRRRFQFVRLLSAALVGLTVQAGGAQGGVIQIFNPDAAYTSSTSKVLIPGSEGQVFNTMTDGTLTISLLSSATHLVVPSTIPMWSSPPDSESATPDVAYLAGAVAVEALKLWADVRELRDRAEPQAEQLPMSK